MQIMPIEPLRMLDYTNWANDIVLDAAAQLSPEQLNAPLRPGWLSAFGVLAHMMASERVWLARWSGHSPQAMPTLEEPGSLDALRAAWEPLRAEMRQFIQTAGAGDERVRYTTTRGEPFDQALWQLFTHVINHGTEHRSQVAFFLATQGIDTGNLDLVYFWRQANEA